MTRPFREVVRCLLVSAALQLGAAILAICALDGGLAVQVVGAAMLLNVMLTILVLRRWGEAPPRAARWVLRYGFLGALAAMAGLLLLLGGRW